MNKELQKTICEQMPHDLKGWDMKAMPGEEIISIMCIDFNNKPDPIFADEHGNYDIQENDLKPILRRMDLTKPITHKGKETSALKELFKASGYEGFQLRYESEKYMCHFWAEGEDDSHVWLFFDEWYNFPQWACDKLSEFHYNWRGIPDELVKYTDEFDYDVY